MSKNWKTALAALGVTPRQPKMSLEIDGSNGEKLIFVDANDITEIAVDSAVTAEDGEHVFEADGKTYKITVLSGKVTAMEEVTPEPAPAPEPPVNVETEMSEEMREALQAVATELENKDSEIAALNAQISEMKTSFTELKALMSHGKDDEKEKKQINHLIKVR